MEREHDVEWEEQERGLVLPSLMDVRLQNRRAGSAD